MSGSRTWLSARLWIHLLVLRPLLRILFGVSVEGKSHLVGLDRFVLASNHNSHLDVMLLFGVLPVKQIRRTRPVAARDYFARRPVLFRVVDYLFRPVWIVRDDPAEDALASMLDALRDGDSIVIFPEGTRGAPGKLGRFRSGVGRLVEALPDVPVVPVFLFGPERALPKDSAVPLPLWNRVVIGSPQRFEGGCTDTATRVEEMVRELRRSETGSRHRRVARPARCFTLAVLGIDGSGKSTLSSRVARELSRVCRVARVSDRLEFYESGGCTTVRSLPSEAARQAVGRYAKTARSLKHYKVPKLAELLLRDHLVSEIRRWHAPDVTVMDGSPLINMTAWARLYHEELHDPEVAEAALRLLGGRSEKSGSEPAALAQLPELAALRRLKLARLHLPDALVMLDVDPSVCIERILGRGERVQAHESLEKLTRLRDGYLMVCEVARKRLATPVRVLDGALDPDTLASATMEFLHDCRSMEKPDVVRSD